MTAQTATKPTTKTKIQPDSGYLLRQIESQAKIVDDAQRSLDAAKDVYKTRAKRLKEEYKKLTDMCRKPNMELFESATRDKEFLPTLEAAKVLSQPAFPFPAKEVAATGADGEDGEDDSSTADPAEPEMSADLPGQTSLPTDDDSWRSIELGSLEDWPAGTLGHLASKELLTLGAIADWTGVLGRQLTDVRGISRKKAEMIEKRLERFWEERATVPVEAKLGEGE